MRIAVPNLLSFLATHDFHGYVPGVNDIIKGDYTKPDGTQELPLTEKIERGKKALTAMANYRRGFYEGEDKSVLQAYTKTIEENMAYFGYGYIKDAEQIVPFIPLCFYAFRVMVGLGTLFVLFFLVVLFVIYKKDITRMRWLLWHCCR